MKSIDFQRRTPSSRQSRNKAQSVERRFDTAQRTEARAIVVVVVVVVVVIVVIVVIAIVDGQCVFCCGVCSINYAAVVEDNFLAVVLIVVVVGCRVGHVNVFITLLIIVIRIAVFVSTKPIASQTRNHLTKQQR